jgi:predicted component of type VI protein secretion system
MWESGGEAEPGTRELLEVFDDPLQKLRHWMHEGGSLLRISPDNLAACARWMLLFGLNLEDWPREHWYNLVLLLLDLPALERGGAGIRRALERVPGLPLKSMSFQPSLALLEEKNISRLGSHASRLGVDLIVGDAIEDLAHLRIVIGPVDLDVYDKYAMGNGRRLLDQVLALILPFHLDYEIRWVVLDAERAPQLGFAECNGRLGVNSYLGEKAEMR